MPQLSDAVELIVVDNASDVSVKSFINDARVRVVRNDINIGLVGNFLRSFEVAKADWLWLIGDDDEAQPDSVATILSHIARYRNSGHMFFSNYMGAISETRASQNDDDLIECWPAADFGARLWVSGQIMNRRLAQNNLRYAYAFPSSSPQLVIALLAAKSDQIVFSDKEIAIHHSADYKNMWDPYTVYDQMCQMFSLDIGAKLRSHMAYCFNAFFSPYDKHFLEVLNSRFNEYEKFPEMRRIFMKRWQAVFSCFDNYRELLDDLNTKIDLLDSAEASVQFYQQLSNQQKNMLWPGSRVGIID